MTAATPGVSLSWLFDGIAALPANSARVTDLTLDSREVRAGSLFLALRGEHTHGLCFAAEAVARGASVVLWEPGGAEDAVPWVAPGQPAPVFAAPIAGLRQLVGRIADRFFGAPSSCLRVVGVTGTNGKTTAAYLLAQCLNGLQSDAAYMGTLGWGRPGALAAPTHTTPDVVTVHRQLAQLHAAGVRDVAMEVSSHALDQGRVDGVRFHCAAFTNLTRDHLDYHPTMAAYGAAKARLFAVANLGHRVINVGDGFGRELAASYAGGAPLTAVWVGAGEAGRFADRSLWVNEVQLELRGISLALNGSFGTARVATRLLGRFNAENSVVVLGCLLTMGMSLADAGAALARCTAPPGRMELIDGAGGGKPVAVIDYAHTPDALAKALSALREHCRGVLWCVFGCGGDRDPGKRPLMGAIAGELADRIIITDDNPRSENPAGITRAIAEGVAAAGVNSTPWCVIHDRAEEIGMALREAVTDDMVLIAGKGHEDYQIYGATRRRFSDRHEALRHLEAAA